MLLHSSSQIPVEAVDIQPLEGVSYSQEKCIDNVHVSREYVDDGRLDIHIPDSMDVFTEDDGTKCHTEADDIGYEDEKTMLLRHPADRAHIEAEMEDLLNAVPRIKNEYTLLDRLGEGIRTAISSAWTPH